MDIISNYWNIQIFNYVFLFIKLEIVVRTDVYIMDEENHWILKGFDGKINFVYHIAINISWEKLVPFFEMSLRRINFNRRFIALQDKLYPIWLCFNPFYLRNLKCLCPLFTYYLQSFIKHIINYLIFIDYSQPSHTTYLPFN